MTTVLLFQVSVSRSLLPCIRGCFYSVAVLYLAMC